MQNATIAMSDFCCLVIEKNKKKNKIGKRGDRVAI